MKKILPNSNINKKNKYFLQPCSLNLKRFIVQWEDLILTCIVSKRLIRQKKKKKNCTFC